MTEECTSSVNNKKLSTYYLRYQVAKLFEHPSYDHDGASRRLKSRKLQVELIHEVAT